MTPQDLSEGVKRILSHSPAFPNMALFVDIIANPKAGGFRRRRFARLRRSELESLVLESESMPLRHGALTVHLHLTERCGHASAIAQRIIDRSVADGRESLQIIMTAGGDGTSLETAERLVALPEDRKDRYALVRLPLGTGNDGSDGRDLRIALGRFLGALHLERRPAVRVSPAEEGGKDYLWAFNIASIGLDAYVAGRTNTLKSLFPGDSYKFWVNVATMFYDRAYTVLPMRVKAFDQTGKQAHESALPRLFLAMGASGNRQYGSNKRILPGTDNAIAVSQTSLLRKLLVKGPVERGQHEGIPEVEHFSARRIEVEYQERIPLQCDGEVEELARCDFPLVMELVPDLYNVLVP
jgi:diacylglycerol kinase family enzyme